MAIVAIVLLAGLIGASSFNAYPLLHCTIDFSTLVACVAVVLVVLLPFCDRRGTEP